MLPLINVTKYTYILRINTSICEKLHLERVALRCHARITVLTHKIFNDPACFAIYNSCCNLLGHKPCISDESWSNTDSKNIYFDRSSAFRFLATVQWCMDVIFYFTLNAAAKFIWMYSSAHGFKRSADTKFKFFTDMHIVMPLRTENENQEKSPNFID